MNGNDQIAIVRIELEGIEPLIWRRVGVRTSMSLETLHGVIQAAMGWLNSHLWEIEAEEQKYGPRVPGEPDWNKRMQNAGAVTLSSLLARGVTELGYLYDMGDGWQHRVIIEKQRPSEAGVVYPQFLGGERRCPPEDCGGVPGYYEFLRNITSKQKAKRDHARVWYGGPFDANDIDETKIVGALKRIAAAGD
jgi:Plasmid pRiA4b ORF-3-like protein